jgi:hypothetical protein
MQGDQSQPLMAADASNPYGVIANINSQTNQVVSYTITDAQNQPLMIMQPQDYTSFISNPLNGVLANWAPEYALEASNALNDAAQGKGGQAAANAASVLTSIDYWRDMGIGMLGAAAALPSGTSAATNVTSDSSFLYRGILSNGTDGRVALSNGWSVDMEAGGTSQYDIFRSANGGWNWPDNNGAIPNTTSSYSFSTGEAVDRIGSTAGSYLSPVGTPLAGRALAPGSFADPYNQYVVLKPFIVEQSGVAPAFGESGNGVQYKIPDNADGKVSVQYLLDNGYIGVKK